MSHPGGRPSRQDEVERVRQIAGASRESVRNFFHRPQRLSADMRQRIASAVAETGYRPVRRAQDALAGVPIGYQMPKSWSEQSSVMQTQFHELLEAAQTAGAYLVPFIVDPKVPGVDDVVGGTPQERVEPKSGLVGWHREYANNLAKSAYHEIMRERSVQMFVVNDLAVDDPRLAMLETEGISHVALGLPRSSKPDAGRTQHPYVETDNRAAIIEMVCILRDAGCDSFGHVGFSDDASHVTQDRRDSVLEAVGHRIPSFTISYLESRNPGDRAIRSQLRGWIFEHDVDAVLCDSDALAYMTHLAADAAGRSTVQDPGALRDNAHRSLMLTGNDNSLHRRLVPTEEQWMTMIPPEREKMSATMRLLGQLRSGEDSLTKHVMIPPRILRWADRETR